MPNIAEVALGPNRLVVEMKHLVFKNINKLAHGYADVKLKHSVFNQYPLLEDETIEQWTERVLPLLAQENAKKDEESASDYMGRIYKLKMDKNELIKDTIKLVADICGQADKVSDEVIDETPYPLLKAFLLDVFEASDLSVKDFE